MRREVVFVLLIAAVAFGVRTYPAWSAVFTPAGVTFLENDSWYHVRLVENQVRNFPWRVTRDPYAAPGGQFVPIAPLFDTVVATAAVVAHGRAATTAQIERIAAFVPPVLGTLTVIAVWALARRLFGGRAALLAAALASILPGHFLDRTVLGFVDHHALEALLAVATLLTLGWAMAGTSARLPVPGVALGLYLLAWASGAFLVAILGVWLLAFVVLAREAVDLRRAALSTAATAVVALVLVVTFQDWRMHRFGGQVLGLTGLAGLSLAAAALAGWNVGAVRRAQAFGVVVCVGVAGLAAAAWLAPGLLGQVGVDVLRLAPDASRMNVLEARPLFLYSGEWQWSQPWRFFRTGAVIGVAALPPFAFLVWRERRADHLLLLVFTLAAALATIGQNRFGYYLVPACALIGGWLGAVILDWGGVPHAGDPTPNARTRLPMARELAVIAVAGGMFAPNLAPGLLLAPRTGGFPLYWRDTMRWLHAATPPPFPREGPDDAYYYARYPATESPSPDYTVMNWWDQGYWVAQAARRVPVSNPTQERAPNAARFYVEPDETRAVALLDAEGSRYVIADWELPFRMLPGGTVMGRFQSVLDWAGGDHARYYEVYYQREGGGWRPVWIFHEPYYQSMAFRLVVLGGASTIPSQATSVITFADRLDGGGQRFRELLAVDTYATFDEARAAAASRASSDVLIVGTDPWNSAFPLDALRTLRPVYGSRPSGLPTTPDPIVRVFEKR